MWMKRLPQPPTMSRIVWDVDVNAQSVWGMKCIDSKTPVAIWMVRTVARRNPMFHMVEIEEGVGRSTREDLMIFSVGLLLRICFFIRMLIGLG